MLLVSDASTLLIVDLQEKLTPVLHDSNSVVHGAKVLAQAALLLDIPIVVSEQYPKGLGPTVPTLAALGSKLAIFEKSSFSCLSEGGILAKLNSLRDEGRNTLIICGCEAHVCVLQTAIEAVDHGFKVGVVWNATGSRFPGDKVLAGERLRAAQVSRVSIEMVIFEWLRGADHPSFKTLSTLIK